MYKKLMQFTDRQINRIGKDADDFGISFTEMTRRILDQHYENKDRYFNIVYSNDSSKFVSYSISSYSFDTTSFSRK